MRADAARAAVLAGALLATGCLSGNSYRLAKTLPARSVEGHVGISIFGFEEDGRTAAGGAPSGSLRVGLGRGVEAGLLLSAQPRFAADVVYQLPLDLGPAHLAVGAGPFVGALPLEGANTDANDLIVGVDGVVIADAWIGDQLAFVGFGGPTYANAPGADVDAGLIQFGGGLRLMPGERFGIHIESTTLWNPSFAEAIDTAVGFAVVLGNVRRE